MGVQHLVTAVEKWPSGRGPADERGSLLPGRASTVTAGLVGRVDAVAEGERLAAGSPNRSKPGRGDLRATPGRSGSRAPRTGVGALSLRGAVAGPRRRSRRSAERPASSPSCAPSRAACRPGRTARPAATGRRTALRNEESASLPVSLAFSASSVSGVGSSATGTWERLERPGQRSMSSRRASGGRARLHAGASWTGSTTATLIGCVTGSDATYTRWVTKLLITAVRVVGPAQLHPHRIDAIARRRRRRHAEEERALAQLPTCTPSSGARTSPSCLPRLLPWSVPPRKFVRFRSAST